MSQQSSHTQDAIILKHGDTQEKMIVSDTQEVLDAIRKHFPGLTIQFVKAHQPSMHEVSVAHEEAERKAEVILDPDSAQVAGSTSPSHQTTFSSPPQSPSSIQEDMISITIYASHGENQVSFSVRISKEDRVRKLANRAGKLVGLPRELVQLVHGQTTLKHHKRVKHYLQRGDVIWVSRCGS